MDDIEIIKTNQTCRLVREELTRYRRLLGISQSKRYHYGLQYFINEQWSETNWLRTKADAFWCYKIGKDVSK